MDSRAAIIASCWFAVAVISAMYLYVGDITLTTNIVVGLLVFVAFMTTFAVTFGLEGMRKESPMTKAKVQISTELTEIETIVSELAKKVDAIQKELEEKRTRFMGHNIFLQIANDLIFHVFQLSNLLSTALQQDQALELADA